MKCALTMGMLDVIVCLDLCVCVFLAMSVNISRVFYAISILFHVFLLIFTSFPCIVIGLMFISYISYKISYKIF